MGGSVGRGDKRVETDQGCPHVKAQPILKVKLLQPAPSATQLDPTSITQINVGQPV